MASKGESRAGKMSSSLRRVYGGDRLFLAADSGCECNLAKPVIGMTGGTSGRLIERQRDDRLHHPTVAGIDIAAPCAEVDIVAFAFDIDHRI